MEAVQDVVISGAGLTGLATALGLYRKGLRSVIRKVAVLESACAVIAQMLNELQASPCRLGDLKLAKAPPSFLGEGSEETAE